MRNWQTGPEARNEFCIEGDIVWIKLTQGQETCVDLEDWKKVREFKWHATKSRDGTFYADTHVKLHSLVMGSVGKGQAQPVDHKESRTLDNRKSQLRLSSVSQNCANRKMNSNNTSGFRGVHRSRDNKWAVKGLGRFDSPVEAAMTYDRAALEKYGEFARLNFPRGQFGAFAL